MMPQSHYEERFTYYDSVQNASFNTKDYCTYYFGKERENKRKIYFETLNIHHKHLYDLEMEEEKGKYFSTRNSPLGWIVWYGMIIIIQYQEIQIIYMGIMCRPHDIFKTPLISKNKVS